MATTYAETGGPGGLFDPADFLVYLNRCYGDPNLRRSARARLDRLKQGDKESFAAFLPKFEKELADSGGAVWSDDIKIDRLEKTLNAQMTDLLYNKRRMLTDYFGFLQELQELGANLEKKRYITQKSKQPQEFPSYRTFGKPQGGQPSSTPQGDTMDWEPTKVNRAVQKQNKDLKNKRAKWVDQEELDRRRKEGRCFRCGRTGCSVASCPLLPPRKPSQTTKANARRIKPVLEAAVEEDSDVSGSTMSEGDRESEKE